MPEHTWDSLRHGSPPRRCVCCQPTSTEQLPRFDWHLARHIARAHVGLCFWGAGFRSLRWSPDHILVIKTTISCELLCHKLTETKSSKTKSYWHFWGLLSILKKKTFINVAIASADLVNGSNGCKLYAPYLDYFKGTGKTLRTLVITKNNC